MLVQNHQAETIIVKRLIEGRNNVTRVRVKPRSYNQTPLPTRPLFLQTEVADSKRDKCEGFAKAQTALHLINSAKLHSLLTSCSFVIACFSVGVAGQQLEIKLPHFTVFHRIHRFAWMKSEAISSKILNLIDLSGSS